LSRSCGASWREAYPRRDRCDVDAPHAVAAQRDQPLACDRGVLDERLDLDALAARREVAETLDPFL